MPTSRNARMPKLAFEELCVRNLSPFSRPFWPDSQLITMGKWFCIMHSGFFSQTLQLDTSLETFKSGEIWISDVSFPWLSTPKVDLTSLPISWKISSALLWYNLQPRPTHRPKPHALTHATQLERDLRCQPEHVAAWTQYELHEVRNRRA